MPRPGPWLWMAVGYAVLYVAFRLASPGTPTRTSLELVAFLPFSIATAFAFLLAARRCPDPGFRRGFRLYAWSFAFTALGTVIWSFQQLLLRVDPTYSWGNIPYLLSYAFGIAGILAFPPSHVGREGRTQTLLDTTIAVIAAVTVTWIAVVQPLAAAGDSTAHRALLFAYPVADLVMFAVLVPLLLNLRGRTNAATVWLLGMGQLTYIAGDLAYQLVTTRQVGLLGVIVDVGYIAGYLGLLWSAEAAARRPNDAVVRDETAPRPPATNPLPLLLGLLVYALLLYEVTRTSHRTAIVLASAAVMVTLLIVAREAMVVRLNAQLSRELDAERAEARLRSVLRHLPTGVVVVDGNGRVAMTNNAARILLGRSEASLAQTDAAVRDAVHEDGSEANDPVQLARDALAARRPIRNVVVGLGAGPEHHRRWLLVNAEPRLGAAGLVEEVTCTLQDITERRELDERLRQSQRMEAVGKLAGGVAHDFNNLLTAITGYAALLHESLPAEDRRTDDVTQILQAADRAAALTQQLLAYGRRQLLLPEVVDVNAAVRDLSRLMHEVLGGRTRVECRLAPDVRPVIVDRHQFEQVLLNLAVNARDAMTGGGDFVIATRNVDDPDELPTGIAMPPDGGVLISVRDTGSGMDEEVRARAFEPFFTTKAVGKGTGLGLSSVYGVMRQSHGEVWIESESGRGTTVFLLLPGHAGAPSEPSDEAVGLPGTS